MHTATPERFALERGARLRDGRYEIRALLGAGGYGQVYEAFDAAANRCIALKTLHAHVAADPSALKHEYRSLVDMRHPNLVALHELFVDEGRVFLTMELVRGQRFMDYVRPNSRLRDARLRRSLPQLTAALSAIHACGKLHRDLKPSNVLATARGRIVVLDFGLVSSQFSAVATDEIGGTPAYMAPEQAHGGQLNSACDWYAVGVMLYEALTGRLPFTGPALAIVHEKQLGLPIPPIEIAPEISHTWNSLCMRLLATRPEDRASAADILTEIGEQRLRARTPSRVREPNAFCGRDRELAQLRELVYDKAETKPVLVSISGESGMGKTCFASHFLEQLSRSPQPAVVLSGRCYERETLPYKAFDNVLDTLCHYLKRLPDAEAAALLPRDVVALARLFPVFRRVPVIARARERARLPVDPLEVKTRAFAALKELLGRLSDSVRVVLCVDDAQWGDVDSAKLLAHLLVPPNSAALSCILIYRRGDREHSVCLLALDEALQGAGIARHALELGPLEPHVLREIAARVTGESAPRFEHVSVEAQGNPYFLMELLEQRSADTPLSLEVALGRRVTLLRVNQRRVLSAVAVAGRPLPASLIGQVCRLSAADTHRILAELEQARLVRNVGADFECRDIFHERVREVVLARLPARVLQRQHRAFVRSLSAQADLEPRVLVEHLLGAGQRARAARHAARAAALASDALAFERAAELYALALTCGEHGRRKERELLAARADALARAGHCAEAGRLYLQSMRGRSRASALGIEALGAKHLMNSGHVDEGTALWVNVLAQYGVQLPDSWEDSWQALGRTLTDTFVRGFDFDERPEAECRPEDLARVDACIEAWLGTWTVDIRGRTSALLGYAVREALLLGEPRRVLRALCILRCGAPPTRPPVDPQLVRRRSSDFHSKWSELAARFEDPDSRAWVQFAAGMSSFWSFRWADAMSRFDAADELWSSHCVDVTRQLGVVRSLTLTIAQWGASTLANFAERADRYLKDSLARGDRYLATWAHDYRAELSIRAGRVEAARAELESAARVWQGSDGFDYISWSLWRNRMRLELYAGRVDAALTLLERSWSDFMRSDIARGAAFMFRSLNDRTSVLLAAAADDRRLLDEIERTVADMQALVDRAPFHSELLASRAGLQALRGERAEALRTLHRAEVAACETALDLRSAALRALRARLTADRELARTAEAQLHAAGVAEPLRWAAHLHPGLCTVETLR